MITAEDFEKWLKARLTWEWFFLTSIGIALLITHLYIKSKNK